MNFTIYNDKMQQMNKDLFQEMVNEAAASQLKQKKEMLGSEIHALRLSGLRTQKQLAEKLGTVRQHVYKWEHGICKPNPIHLMQIIELSGLDNCDEIYQRLINEFYLY